MKTVLKFLKWTGIVVLLLVVAIFAFVQLSWDKTFESPYPDISAATDSASIARGGYIFNGPAHCNLCHIPNDKIDAIRAGEVVAPSGGLEFEFPGMGVFRTPNITPDAETGIGKLTDADIARAIRNGVTHTGKAMLPFMDFQDMVDSDIAAVIGYMRSMEPVKHEVKGHEYGFIGKALGAFGLLKPVGPESTPPKTITPDSTAEYGRYIIYALSSCKNCHTQADMTGKPVGPALAGGGAFPGDKLTMGYSFISPNLTPDPETGVMAEWSEAQFIQRFRSGRIEEGSPMPWENFSKFTDSDLKAIYRYLNSLEPVSKKIEKTVFEPGEKLPKS